MDAGLVVVLAVSGVFLLVPLAFAWVSTNPRRWARVEGVLGREPVGRAPPRWLFVAWAGLGIVYIGSGIIQARTAERDGFPWVTILIGILWMLNGGTQYLIYRRRRAKELSADTQVEDRAEPGGPRAGG
jgi:hypothetical protein